MSFDDWEPCSGLDIKYGGYDNLSGSDVYEMMEHTWNYQQERIDELESQLKEALERASL